MNPVRVGLISIFVVLLTAMSLAADVRSFGAKGDGVADDTAAVQKAVGAGGGIHFPAGTYRLTRTIGIELDKTGFVSLTGDGTARIVMAGAGPAFEFVGTHGGSADPQQFKPNVWDRQRSPRVDALEIVGAHPEADGIAARGTMQITLSRLLIREARHAVRLYERNRNVLITDCHFYHNRGVGVFLDHVDLHQTNINGSHISYNGGGGVVTRGGAVRNLHIGNCDIESNMWPNTPPTANVLIDSTGGSTGEVAITGCTIQHNSKGPNSANVRILGRGQTSATTRTPATPTSEGHVTITGNVLSDVQVNIDLQGARGVTITGNTFWMGFQHDLLIENSSHVIVGPNNFDRNPRYDSQQRDARCGIVIRGSRDCTLTGFQVSGVRQHEAAVVLQDCERMNLSDATILDSDGIGLAVRNTSLSRISGCVIRDDRTEPNRAPALVVAGGYGNSITGNLLDRAPEISGASGTSRDNEVVARGAGARR